LTADRFLHVSAAFSYTRAGSAICDAMEITAQKQLSFHSGALADDFGSSITNHLLRICWGGESRIPTLVCACTAFQKWPFDGFALEAWCKMNFLFTE
jgi:hypothetical protein